MIDPNKSEAELRGRVKALEDCARAALLFLDPKAWDNEMNRQWMKLVGNECTVEALRAFISNRLGEGK